jgi:hypothetical protein
LENQQQVGKVIPTLKKGMMIEIAMEIYQEMKEYNVEGMGNSSSNLFPQELVEKLTTQTNNFLENANSLIWKDDNPRIQKINIRNSFKNLCTYQHLKEMQD